MAPPLPEATPTLTGSGRNAWNLGPTCRCNCLACFPGSPRGPLLGRETWALRSWGLYPQSARVQGTNDASGAEDQPAATRPGLPQVRRRGLKGAAPWRNAGGRRRRAPAAGSCAGGASACPGAGFPQVAMRTVRVRA